MIDSGAQLWYDRTTSAGMAELADAQDLGSCEAIRVGSTPTTRTKKKDMTFGHVFLFGFQPSKAASTL